VTITRARLGMPSRESLSFEPLLHGLAVLGAHFTLSPDARIGHGQLGQDCQGLGPGHISNNCHDWAGHEKGFNDAASALTGVLVVTPRLCNGALWEAPLGNLRLACAVHQGSVVRAMLPPRYQARPHLHEDARARMAD